MAVSYCWLIGGRKYLPWVDEGNDWQEEAVPIMGGFVLGGKGCVVVTIKTMRTPNRRLGVACVREGRLD